MNRYPRGKLNDDDDGELMIAITEQDNTVIISFGKMVSWITRMETVLCPQCAELARPAKAEGRE